MGEDQHLYAFYMDVIMDVLDVLQRRRQKQQPTSPIPYKFQDVLKKDQAMGLEYLPTYIDPINLCHFM